MYWEEQEEQAMARDEMVDHLWAEYKEHHFLDTMAASKAIPLNELFQIYNDSDNVESRRKSSQEA